MHLATLLIFCLALVLEGALRRGRLPFSQSLHKKKKKTLSSLDGGKEKYLLLMRRRTEQFSSALPPQLLFLQGLPGVPGEQGVPGPAGLQVRRDRKKESCGMTKEDCLHGAFHWK